MSIVLLARHAQASFGAADYDELSELGQRQSALLSAALAERGVRPGRVLHGEHRRHAQTAENAQWPHALVDPRWNEFDHHPILEAATAAVDLEPEEGWLLAKERWAGGQHDSDYVVTFASFTKTVMTALDDAVRTAEPGQPAVVISSAGAISAIVAGLLRGSPDLWLRLQTVIVNTGITKISVGQRGRTLISFNEHSHLEPYSITYR